MLSRAASPILSTMSREISTALRAAACAPFLWGLALLLAGCGQSILDETSGGGQAGSGGAAGATAGSGGAASTGGDGGAPSPAGVLCDEVSVPAGSCPASNYQEPLVGFVAASGVIFRGTVTALNETTPGIDLADTSRAVVVHVDEPLFVGGMLDIGGQAVTVQLLSAPTMDVGYEGYFFTSVWLLGQSVGVTEVAHVDPGVYPTIESDVPGIEELLADERLFARMETATSVLAGTVSAITPLPGTGPASEHDPLWAEATLTADCTLRGAELPSAKVAFATSDDVAWFESPKLTVGQQGIFLLQPAPAPPGPWAIPDSIPYVVTSPLDVETPDERAHVATLVLCPPTH